MDGRSAAARGDRGMNTQAPVRRAILRPGVNLEHLRVRPARIRHARRVAEMSVRIGRRLRLDAGFLEDLEEAVPLHDIGKLMVPAWILDKRGPLSEYERALMQTHPLAGGRLLRATGEPTLELAAEIAESHHERWDGGG